MKLKEYKEKRAFEKTPEPRPEIGHKGKPDQLVFVVHKHAASRLHYDLRLELDGVLKSFAIPKGPSLNPSIKRLAVMVEDHPFDYKDFEGVIPEGNYGAGGVIIWDQGVYRHPRTMNKEESERALREGLKKGDLKFVLAGKKLKGEFALVKTGWDEKSWLLLKKKDPYVSTKDILEENRSVVSNKTVEEISGHNPQKISGRRKARMTRKPNTDMDRILSGAPRADQPHHVTPMMASTTKKPFDDPDWIFEIKWDGYRAIAEIDKGSVLLYSRNQKSFMKDYSTIVDSLKKIRFEAVLDGEIVVMDGTGLPDFQMLQDYTKTHRGNLVYYVFDILHYQGHDLTGLPLSFRKELLKSILPEDRFVRYADHVWKEGTAFFRAAKEKGLEGIMAKSAKSLYKTGLRSSNWLKIKNRLVQDCVVVGFTEPRGSRKHFGSLVLGAFEGGRLVYVGHSGGGFSEELLKKTHERLRALVRPDCPLVSFPSKDASITWVEPVLVGEFAFTEWTQDNVMRHPIFLRFREDKKPAEAVRESPANPSLKAGSK